MSHSSGRLVGRRRSREISEEEGGEVSLEEEGGEKPNVKAVEEDE